MSGGSGRASIAVRLGRVLAHAAGVQEAAELMHALDAMSRDTANGRDVDELLRFPALFLEAVAEAGVVAQTPGKALACARACLGPKLVNEVRGLLRARGHAGHPVPAAKSKRILDEVEEAVHEFRQRREEMAQAAAEGQPGWGSLTVGSDTDPEQERELKKRASP